MTIDFSNIPILQNDNVRMKAPDSVLAKLNKIIAGKKENLQIITDYDLTITKQHVDGEKTLSSFGLLTLWEQLPSGFMEEDMKIKEKYYPIEVDLNMTEEEKIPYMLEWYSESQRLWNGIQLNISELRALITKLKPQLRDGAVSLFKVLEEHEIPVLVLSAGLGDVLVEVLRYHGLVENNYFHVISNFFKLNNDVVEGYGCRENGSFIHPFNKNGLGCSSYFKEIGDKSNVILMGDSLGDARMDYGIPSLKTVLKIGFLYGTSTVIEKSLPKFLDCFDIVLVDDQTMNVVKAIVNLIIES